MNTPHRRPAASSGSLAAMMLLVQLPVLLGGCPWALGPGDDPLPGGDPPDTSGSGLPCVACHSGAMGQRRPVANSSGMRGHAMGAPPQQDASCRACHEMAQHRQGKVRLWDNPITPDAVIVLDGDPSADPAEAEKLVPFCGVCHSDSAFDVHAVGGDWRPACTACHDVHDQTGANRSMVWASIHSRTLGVDKAVVFTTRTGPGSFDDGDPAANDGICQVCHTATRYHRHDGTGTAHHGGEDCTTCHAHKTGFFPDAAGVSCAQCHSEQQGTRPAVVGADGSGGHHLGGGTLTEADCLVCHELSRHRQGNVRLWENPNSPSAVIVVTGEADQLVVFCEACHGGTDQPTAHATGGAWQPACTACHEMHDPANTNLSLVADGVRSETLGLDKAVVFTARTGPGSFSDGTGANDGICQVCHTATRHHLHDGGSAPHSDGADCTNCHPHGSGFRLAGTACTVCHSSPQGGRRAVIGEFALASHHLQTASPDAADCIVCHEMSQHQQGRVRLNDVDDPDNPAAVIELGGDPAAILTEAVKLEAFCLACHDGDGAAGAAPFGDGIVPAPVDAALWAAASHKLGGSAGPMTCFGDGETFGCHAGAHGSAKQMLLAPPDASQPPVAGDPLRQEEGLCYTCHDADGPAGTDVASQFALAHHHNVSALDQTDGSHVECIDCHNPHTASSAVMLADPDAGGAWGGTVVDFCLTCHDGSPPSGVAFPDDSPGTGYDKSTFAGTTHADELGGDSCGHCHADHGSAYRSILRDEYVIADNNTYAEGDYALCWTCHDAAATVLAANAFEDHHEEHVVDETAPCIICHDVHAPADPDEPGLINFAFAAAGGYDLELVNRYGTYTPSTAFWIDPAPPPLGFCALTCHGEEHPPKAYERTPDPIVDCSGCHAP